MFTKGFQKFACEGDSISCEVEGFTVTARLFRDDCGDAPEDRDQFFSDVPEAKAIREAWARDEWFYCGVSVTVEREGVCIIGEYGHALWGVECNYPGSDNAYLREVANELLPEALSEAKRVVKKLCAAT